MMISPDTPDLAWVNDAACATMPAVRRELIGLDRSRPSAIAKVTCRMCPVRVDCLVSAFESGSDYGWFGGVAPARRRDAGSAAAVVEDLVRSGELPVDALSRFADTPLAAA